LTRSIYFPQEICSPGLAKVLQVGNSLLSWMEGGRKFRLYNENLIWVAT